MRTRRGRFVLRLNENAISRVTKAEADTALKVADAALRRAREDLDRMTIKAPFAGIMGLTWSVHRATHN